MGVFSAIFWGVVTLSFLVFIHEAGHFLAARACNMRVTEFFLGMPCRLKLSRRSRRLGTEIGVTPILLGGYTRICGMEGNPDPRLPEALWRVQTHGRVRAEVLAEEIGCTAEEAYGMLAMLVDWASVEPYYDEALGEEPGQRDWPQAFQTVKRDAALRTIYDRGNDFSAPGATEAGEPRVPDMGAEAFCRAEKARTYQGHGMWQRILTLIAGPAINVVFALAVVVAGLTIAGVSVTVDRNEIGTVQAGSLAADSGLEPGDIVSKVGSTPVDSWQSLVSALQPELQSGQSFTLTVERAGETKTVEIAQDPAEPRTMLGITAPSQRVRLGVVQAVRAAFIYAGAVAEAAVSLIVPSQTMQVLNQSSSVMGISVMASEAASHGAWDLMQFMAMISLSLGFMNLLPIPPLDGGKILIEICQKIARRDIPTKVQIGISYAGIAFFIFVFVFVLRNDIVRFVIG